MLLLFTHIRNTVIQGQPPEPFSSQVDPLHVGDAVPLIPPVLEQAPHPDVPRPQPQLDPNVAAVVLRPPLGRDGVRVSHHLVLYVRTHVEENGNGDGNFSGYGSRQGENEMEFASIIYAVKESKFPNDRHEFAGKIAGARNKRGWLPGMRIGVLRTIESSSRVSISRPKTPHGKQNQKQK